jgi:hypothetical protein
MTAAGARRRVEEEEGIESGFSGLLEIEET